MKAYEIWTRTAKHKTDSTKDMWMRVPNVFFSYEAANELIGDALRKQATQGGVHVIGQTKDQAENYKIIEIEIKTEEEFKKPNILMD